jgi:hypothetical protein
MQKASRRVILGTAVAAVVAGCSEKAVGPVTAPPLTSPPLSPSPSPRPRPTPTVRRVSDVGPLPPNELGSIPVLMFHRVSDPVLGEFDITPDALWDLLVRLHTEGYRPIRLVDLVRRRLDVPRGRTPVVLTFDDSSPGQFHRFATGGVDPKSGVGILQAFQRKYPTFRACGTMFLNAHPFADPDTPVALQSLVRDGFELGNHTFDHVNLGNVSATDGQREISALQDLVRGAAKGLKPVSFSLPYGVWPADRTVPVSGGTGAQAYRHEAVVLVGADPAPSPYSVHWDPTAVPRIRASSWQGGQQPFCASWWLDRLAQDPGQRYVASGQAGTVTFPRTLADTLRPELQRRARPYSV